MIAVSKAVEVKKGREKIPHARLTSGAPQYPQQTDQNWLEETGWRAKMNSQFIQRMMLTVIDRIGLEPQSLKQVDT